MTRALAMRSCAHQRCVHGSAPLSQCCGASTCWANRSCGTELGSKMESMGKSPAGRNVPVPSPPELRARGTELGRRHLTKLGRRGTAVREDILLLLLSWLWAMRATPSFPGVLRGQLPFLPCQGMLWVHYQGFCRLGSSKNQRNWTCLAPKTPIFPRETVMRPRGGQELGDEGTGVRRTSWARPNSVPLALSSAGDGI